MQQQQLHHHLPHGAAPPPPLAPPPRGRTRRRCVAPQAAAPQAAQASTAQLLKAQLRQTITKLNSQSSGAPQQQDEAEFLRLVRAPQHMGWPEAHLGRHTPTQVTLSLRRWSSSRRSTPRPSPRRPR